MTTNHFDNRPHTQPNGDPGGEDKFDGGCPSDTVQAAIVPSLSDHATYARLIVWENADPDLFQFGRGAKGENLASVEEWNEEGNSGKAYLARVPLPEPRS
jgi:hypothetical protein